MLKIKKFFVDPAKRESTLLLIFTFIFLLFLWERDILFSIPHLTLIAVLVALFGRRLQGWFDRPIIEVDFDPSSDRCLRDAMPINDSVQNFNQFKPKKREYFRLKVTNEGRGVAKKVKIVIDLYYKNNKEVERFEPNCLSWITGDKEIDIASKEVTYINILSQVTDFSNPEELNPEKLFVIRWEIFDKRPRGIAWDRVSQEYLIKTIVHGDNVEAKTYWFKFIPDKNNVFKVGQLKRLKSSPL